MINKQYRAVDSSLEKKQSDVIRDTRPLSEVIMEGAVGDVGFPTLMAMMGFMPIIMPASSFFAVPLAGALFLARKFKKKEERLSMRVPSVANATDYGDMLPGRRSYSKGLGTFYMGVDQFGGELWLRASDILTHLVVLGTTGSGKTVTLTALASNYLAMGGGFIYTDPKAAPGLWRNFHVLVRLVGRDDDLRLANYMTAGAPTDKEGPERLSNTINPFAFGNADQLTQLLNSLIEVSGGDNAVFGQNAMMAVASLMLCLVDLRDKEHIELSISTIRDYFNPVKMIGLALDERINVNARDSVSAFLGSMGWQVDKPADNQPRAFGEQFQYAKAYYGQALNSLTDTYGHIYRHLAGEIDTIDVIKNRRILINMLPSLEKSPAELKQLGKVNLSAIRNAISIGLGDRVEGSINDVTESLPLASPVPFGIVTDEYGAIPTPGFAEVMTQGRGLRISSLTGTQDLDGMQGDNATDKRGAMQIIENTKIKIGMKIAGAGETWNLWKGLADEAYVMQTQGSSIGGRNAQSGQQSAYDISYKDGQSTSVTKVSRVDLKDMQEQAEGEFHAFVNGDIIRGDMFFDPLFDNPGEKNVNTMDYNLNIVRLMYVEPPNFQDLSARRGDLKSLLDKVVTRSKKEDWLPRGEINPIFASVAAKLASSKMNESKELIAISAFMAWVDSESTGHSAIDSLLKQQQEDKAESINDDEDIGKASVKVIEANTQFAPVMPFRNPTGEDKEESSPLSSMTSKLSWMDEEGGDNREALVKDVALVERTLGGEELSEGAEIVAEQLGLATQYPTMPIPKKASNSEFESIISSFIGDT